MEGSLLLEDGSYFLLEDGSHLLLETLPVITTTGNDQPTVIMI